MDRLAPVGAKPPSLNPLKERNRFIRWCLELLRELFLVLLITFLLLILVETIFEGSVSYYVNLNYLLIILIVVGIAAVLTTPGKAEMVKGEHLTTKSVLMIICAGIGGAAIIWYKTQEIGWLSYVISAVSGGLIVLLSMLIWRGDEEVKKEAERQAEKELKEKPKGGE